MERSSTVLNHGASTSSRYHHDRPLPPLYQTPYGPPARWGPIIHCTHFTKKAAQDTRKPQADPSPKKARRGSTLPHHARVSETPVVTPLVDHDPSSWTPSLLPRSSRRILSADVRPTQRHNHQHRFLDHDHSGAQRWRPDQQRRAQEQRCSDQRIPHVTLACGSATTKTLLGVGT